MVSLVLSDFDRAYRFREYFGHIFGSTIAKISKMKILRIYTDFQLFRIIDFEFTINFACRLLFQFHNFINFQKQIGIFSVHLEGASHPSLRHAEGATRLINSFVSAVLERVVRRTLLRGCVYAIQGVQ